MEMELSSDGGECKGGSGVGYGKKPMGVIQPNLIGWNVKVKAMSLSPVDKWSTIDHQSPYEYNSVEL